MLTFLVILVLVVGINTTLWGLVGLGRVAHGALRRGEPEAGPLTADDVAVLIAAHNEEMVIAATVKSARSLFPRGHVFVASDGSSDRTVTIARRHGARVVELNPNRGKAAALSAAIDHFKLASEFEIVLLLDADTRLDDDYLTSGLPLFRDPNVVAVAGRATTIVDPPSPTWFGRFLVAYRERFYIVVQYILKFGQAARAANAVSIVPGFASMYRSRILGRIDICPPGLVIEDFNMTFEVHAKQLGRIAFHPSAAIAHTQDPDTFSDYTKQLSRWSLGFWQTIRRHGLHFGKFWGALALYIFELVSSSVMLLLIVPLLLGSIVAAIFVNLAIDQTGVAAWFSGLVPPLAVALGVLLPDYLLTIFATIVSRRPLYLLMGLGFPVMRVVDAAICIRTLGVAYLGRASRKSTGTWKSPSRRPAPPKDQQSVRVASGQPR